MSECLRIRRKGPVRERGGDRRGPEPRADARLRGVRRGVRLPGHAGLDDDGPALRHKAPAPQRDADAGCRPPAGRAARQERVGRRSASGPLPASGVSHE